MLNLEKNNNFYLYILLTKNLTFNATNCLVGIKKYKKTKLCVRLNNFQL